MKTRYRISEDYVLDFEKGAIVDCGGRMIGITAYQERFLKYLILNAGKPCISNSVKAFVYRGEPIPKETPNFFLQLTQLCPSLRERVQMQRYELMDIGYQYKMPKTAALSAFWPDMDLEELEDDEEIEMDQDEAAKILDILLRKMTPAQKTVLRILMLNHDKPFTYQAIINQSYVVREEGEKPLTTTYEIIEACNGLIESFPEIKEALQPVYVNTIAYLYRLHQEDLMEKNPENETIKKATMDESKIKEKKEMEMIPYPSAENLDSSFYHIKDTTYISAEHGVAITYQDKNLVVCKKLTPQMVKFLDVLLVNSPRFVSKQTLCSEIYEDHDSLSPEPEYDRLYDLKKRLVKLVPEINGNLKPGNGGYCIRFEDYK